MSRYKIKVGTYSKIFEMHSKATKPKVVATHSDGSVTISYDLPNRGFGTKNVMLPMFITKGLKYVNTSGIKRFKITKQ